MEAQWASTRLDSAVPTFTPFSKQTRDRTWTPWLAKSPGLPRLVLMAGRTDESLKKTLDRLEVEGPYPDSAYALLNRVGQPGLKLFPHRGYAMVPVDGSGKPVTKVVEKVPPVKRPLWFVFTGMGCQWNGMARQMMEFDVFARSIRASHDLLAKNFGLDLIDLVTSEKPRGQETVASVLVSIVAIQVALVDVIRAIGLRPDGIVGHSLGEISSAYADEGTHRRAGHAVCLLAGSMHWSG
ncbi:hypothetical protein MRX96_049044 [Rhipicephalus microplus]